MPRTPSRKRWCVPGEARIGSRNDRRCGRGSTGSRPMCASTRFRTRAACASDGGGPGGLRRRPARNPDAIALARAGPGCPCASSRRRPSGAGGASTEHPARVRRGGPAPAAAPACCASSNGGPGLVRLRGCPVPGDVGGGGEQRSSACAVDPRTPRHQTPRIRSRTRRRHSLEQRVDAFLRYDVDTLVTLRLSSRSSVSTSTRSSPTTMPPA